MTDQDVRGEDEQAADRFAAARDGDPLAWHELVVRYTPLVLSVVRRYRLSGAEADDVVQCTWLRLVEHIKDIREPRALPGWIRTTSGHECLRLIRSTDRADVCDFATHDAALVLEGDVDEALLAAERHEILVAAFAELPDHQRNLLLLLVEDPTPSYEEISKRLGIPVGAIGPTRKRALERLRLNAKLLALWRN